MNTLLGEGRRYDRIEINQLLFVYDTAQRGTQTRSCKLRLNVDKIILINIDKSILIN